MACSCAACTQPDCTRTGCRRTSYTYETYPTGMAGYVSPTRGKVSKDTEGGWALPPRGDTLHEGWWSCGWWEARRPPTLPRPRLLRQLE